MEKYCTTIERRQGHRRLFPILCLKDQSPHGHIAKLTMTIILTTCIRRKLKISGSCFRLNIRTLDLASKRHEHVFSYPDSHSFHINWKAILSCPYLEFVSHTDETKFSCFLFRILVVVSVGFKELSDKFIF